MGGNGALGVPTLGINSRLPTLSEEPELCPGSGDFSLHEVCTQIQTWASRKLSHLHPDASLVLIHHKVLESIRATQTLSRSSWWQLPLSGSRSSPGRASTGGGGGAHAPDATVKLASALYHLSSSEDNAWVALLRAFWHGLAVPVGPAASSM